MVTLSERFTAEIVDGTLTVHDARTAGSHSAPVSEYPDVMALIGLVADIDPDAAYILDGYFHVGPGILG